MSGSDRYRAGLGIASRVVAASVGGYATAAAVSSVLALAVVRWGGVARSDAVLWASLFCYALYTALALGVFAARTAGRAWLGLGALALMCAVLWAVMMALADTALS